MVDLCSMANRVSLPSDSSSSPPSLLGSSTIVLLINAALSVLKYGRLMWGGSVVFSMRLLHDLSMMFRRSCMSSVNLNQRHGLARRSARVSVGGKGIGTQNLPLGLCLGLAMWDAGLWYSQRSGQMYISNSCALENPV